MKIQYLRMFRSILSLFIIGSLFTLSSTAQSTYNAYEATADPTIDGFATEQCWADADWKTINQVWLGVTPSASDFQGKYKLCWRGTKLFILAEIVDDVLYDGHVDPLDQWYNDDCVEIFIDENFSHGNHQCTYNAFAYHVAINGDVVDLGNDCLPHLYNSHVNSAHTASGNTYTWEMALTVYDGSYSETGVNTPVTLSIGKTSGLSLAYCDDDGSNNRESFMGSEIMPAGHTNDNYITADYFGQLNLIGPKTATGILEKDLTLYSIEGQIFLKNYSSDRIQRISVLDNSGRVLQTIIPNTEEINIGGTYTQGIYFLHINTDHSSIVKKVLLD